MSHLFFDNRWDKHMWDVQFLLGKGCKYNVDIMMELYEYWKPSYPRHRRSDLDMDKEQFFTNAINYDENEHDYLHTLINPEPLYQKILVEGKEVEISEEQFNNLSYERYRDDHFLVAYSKMMKKFVRQHAPIWMFPFVVENYLQLNRAKFNFITQIQKQLTNGN